MKEELEKEAEKSLDKRLGTYAYIRKQDCYRPYVDGYTDGAEPREKQIADLEAENKDLTLKIDRLESACDAYNYSQRTYQEEIKELKAQIEKTKWHDLRIDPNDLPKKNKSYWVYIDCQGNKIYRSIVWQGCWLGWNCIPLAWCEEPQFKE